MHESYLADFKNDISSRLPGVLAYLNLADARRLNIHLGHETVDKVIEEITSGLAASTASKGASKRVAGDIWLAKLAVRMQCRSDSLIFKPESRYRNIAISREWHFWRCHPPPSGSLGRLRTWRLLPT